MVGAGGARAVARCDMLGLPPYSDMTGGLYRAYLAPAYAAAQGALAAWMREAGMTVRLDSAANLIGRYDGLRDGPALLIGSHIDSVRDGGRYDGPLGVMLGIEAVAALHASGRRLAYPVEVIAFGDEEGSRFPAAMLTSRAVAGTLEADLAAIADPAGLSVAEAVKAYLSAQKIPDVAQPDSAASFASARRAPGSTLAYLEAHIEQGPVLEAEGLALGVVTSIAAQQRYGFTLRGQAGHAGTMPMSLRRDALAGAARMVLTAETLARGGENGLVATVGRLETLPGAANVVPGEVRFTLDVRAGDDVTRDAAAITIVDAFGIIARENKLALTSSLLQDLPASPCAPHLIDLLDAAMADEGFVSRRLVSGAGHDAMIMAAHCPTAMLFIRCRGGISHNPAEHVEAADADAALKVMLAFMERLQNETAA